MNSYNLATFGGGCFWCVEAIFQQVKGVISVVSGYSGGTTKNPSYEEVCNGKTNHAEVVQIQFDPKVVSFSELLFIFWRTHDPTTLNQQGADIGTQYRSIILFHNQEQKKIAEEVKEKIEHLNIWGKPIVTEINQFESFYPSEKEHHNYYINNPNQTYCKFVITPKLEKFNSFYSK